MWYRREVRKERGLFLKEPVAELYVDVVDLAEEPVLMKNSDLTVSEELGLVDEEDQARNEIVKVSCQLEMERLELVAKDYKAKRGGAEDGFGSSGRAACAAGSRSIS